MLFCVTTWQTSGHTRNRGMIFITGIITLVAWLVTLVTCSYMCKNGGKALGPDAEDRVGDSKHKIAVLGQAARPYFTNFGISFFCNQQ